MFRLRYRPYNLHFGFTARTSRGAMTTKPTYFIRVEAVDDPSLCGFGEVPFFPGLSSESEEELLAQMDFLSRGFYREEIGEFNPVSSLRFGLDSVFRDIDNHGSGLLFPSPFTEGKSSIVINGLIWMGDAELMRSRLIEKLAAGFSCIKIKIGAIDWDEELQLIRTLREIAGDKITVRVDANGAFSPEDCLGKLEDLSRFGIHSIEQPIAAGNFSEMRKICELSPIPVALDEELIGIPPGEKRSQILDFISPHYIILKPSLCYGFEGVSDWIARADSREIGWWITSALESSVGLDAISQFTATLSPVIPQGLGTGTLYTNNLASPLSIEGEYLRYTGFPGAWRNQLAAYV